MAMVMEKLCNAPLVQCMNGCVARLKPKSPENRSVESNKGDWAAGDGLSEPNKW